jgi:hypothetical protein
MDKNVKNIQIMSFPVRARVNGKNAPAPGGENLTVLFGQTVDIMKNKAYNVVI